MPGVARVFLPPPSHLLVHLWLQPHLQWFKFTQIAETSPAPSLLPLHLHPGHVTSLSTSWLLWGLWEAARPPKSSSGSSIRELHPWRHHSANQERSQGCLLRLPSFKLSFLLPGITFYLYLESHHSPSLGNNPNEDTTRCYILWTEMFSFGMKQSPKAFIPNKVSVLPLY